jgi:hypothetical protein
VATLLTSYQLKTSGGSYQLVVMPAYNYPVLGLVGYSGAFNFSNLYCSDCTFDSPNIFKLFWQSNQPFTLQYYLFIHRINLAAETPTTGFYLIGD